MSREYRLSAGWCLLQGVLLAVCCSLSPLLWAQDKKPSPHPIVLGFERFHSSDATADAPGGMLLLGDLNCTSCHAADAALETHVVKKQAPILDEIGNRARPEYLAKFLTNPQTTKPGTTMPNVFAGLPEAEAKANAEALAHFLATTGTLNHTLPVRTASLRGEALFHSAGCVVCHGPRKEGSTPIAGSVPLGMPSKKYTFPGMTKFLTDPLAVRPSGRMPHLNLNAQEASDLAAYLLGDLAIPSSLQYAYYEGSWDKLPDFSKLTPKTTSSTEKIDASMGNGKDHFALRFEGTLLIAKEGDYTFSTTSDDGSRLEINNQKVVDNDGIHGDATKQGKIKLTAGKHAFVVEFFEQSGGETLKVEVEGPGLKKSPLETLVAPPETATPSTTPPAWVVNAELAEKGKKLFLSVGCASCHQLKQNGVQLASTAKAEPLAKLLTNAGCLSDQPSAKNPHFALNASQRKAIAEALAATKKPLDALVNSESVVHRNLERFNCYGCHSRGEQGGVEESRNAWFTGSMKEVGDEARIPPHLANVGAKLKEEWLKKVLADGEKVRPYMFTRMPKFGGQNIGGLADHLVKADAGKVPPLPKFDVADTDRKFKAAGKTLVGSQGLGCIKCHTFNGKGTPGIQVMDLNVMTNRLRDDWYYHYMLNPPAFRPGTRMPAAWPNGQAVLTKVLGGDTPKQIRSIWAYMLDGSKAAEPAGLVEAKIELLPIDEPIIYRNFIDGAGPRAIAVGFPQKVNYAWDANHERLAMIWQGAFIDAAMHWVGRGPGYQKPLGENVIHFIQDAPLAKLDSHTTVWPTTTHRDEKDPNFKFHGYHLDAKRQPTFRYSFGDLHVEELIAPNADGEITTLVRTLTFTSDKPIENVYFLAAAGSKLELVKQTLVLNDNLRISLQTSETPTLRESNKRQEALIPIKLKNGKATIVQEFDW